MALSLPKIQNPEARPGNPDGTVAPRLPGPLAHAYLARLAALHDEAAETAHLANLLGRTPWIGFLLGAAALVAVFAADQWLFSLPVVAWLGMIATAIGLIAIFYGRASRAPFDRETLKAFARNISACLLFAGAVWGAGVSLVLPLTVGFQTITLFVSGAAVVVAAILRARDVSLCFLVPAAAMGAFCALLRNFDGAALAGILMSATVIAGTMLFFDRLSSIATLAGRRG